MRRQMIVPMLMAMLSAQNVESPYVQPSHQDREPPPDEVEAQARRELANCKANRARLAAAVAKRKRKAAKRAALLRKGGAK